MCVLTSLPGSSSGIPEQQYLIAACCVPDIVGGLGAANTVPMLFSVSWSSVISSHWS